MYVPPHFEQKDPEEVCGLIESHPFGLLMTTRDGAPFGTHLPFLLDRAAGHLLGHLARANPQWRGLEGGEALAVFTGPHAYVSPGWYEAAGVVPTWNYTAVHAYGRCSLVEGEGLLDILRRSVAAFDREGWVPDEAHMGKLAAGVVGFRMEVSRWEGKWKLSQNHPAERQMKVAAALERAAGEGPAGVAALMRRRLAGG
jgi:transcriptional regulator